MGFRTAFGVLVGLIAALGGVLLFAWLLWWLWTRRDEEKEAPAIEIKMEAPEPAGEPPAVEVEPAAVAETELETEAPEEPPGPDDLTRIEGIGPKISAVLQQAGITTFAQLADTDLARLEQILEEADPRLLRLSSPATWREQAALAAAEEGEALQALQKELKAGRRV